jgi:hypothetical protein
LRALSDIRNTETETKTKESAPKSGAQK